MERSHWDLLDVSDDEETFHPNLTDDLNVRRNAGREPGDGHREDRLAAARRE